MFCPKCGSSLPDNSAICGYCGAPLYASADTANYVAVPSANASGSLLMQENEAEIIKGRTLPLTGILTFVAGLILLAIFASQDIDDLMWIPIATINLGIIMILFSFGTYIAVTNKRVYGTALILFTKRRIDLPLDSITAVSRATFGSLCVSSPSGRANFGWLVNGKIVDEEICKLLVERQNIELAHKMKVENLLSSIQAGR